jgi:hypothetical protein
MSANSTDQLRQFVIDSGGDTGILIVSLYASMRVDQAEQHHRELAADRAWQKRRSKDRAAALRGVAADCCIVGNGPTETAQEVRRRLVRYASSTWRFERDRDPPDNPARARMHTVLALYGGDVPSESTCWRAIVGIS